MWSAPPGVWFIHLQHATVRSLQHDYWQMSAACCRGSSHCSEDWDVGKPLPSKLVFYPCAIKWWYYPDHQKLLSVRSFTLAKTPDWVCLTTPCSLYKSGMIGRLFDTDHVGSEQMHIQLLHNTLHHFAWQCSDCKDDQNQYHSTCLLKHVWLLSCCCLVLFRCPSGSGIQV